MAAFLGFTYIGATWSNLFAISYVIKTLVTAALLIAFRKQYTRISWHYWWLGAVLGIISIVQWIALDKGVLAIWPHYPHMTSDPLNPFAIIHNRAWLYTFLAVRWFGPTLVVPFMEEFFWRDFLWRSIIAPNDFHLADIGEWDWKAVAIVTLLFASVHPQWITAVCGVQASPGCYITRAAWVRASSCTPLPISCSGPTCYIPGIGSIGDRARQQTRVSTRHKKPVGKANGPATAGK